MPLSTPRNVGHVAPNDRDERLMESLVHSADSGHDVVIYPTTNGIAQGLAPEQCSRLAQAGVQVVVNYDEVTGSHCNGALRQLAKEGVEARFHVENHGRFEHKKVMIVDGYILT